MKRKFECTVTREDKYIIEFDDEIINQEWIEDFANDFYDFKDLKEHAEHLAQFRARFPDVSFIEGYRVPLIDGKLPLFSDKNDVEEGINIIVISEDEECEVDVEKIE